jgi:hypothetical protein
MASFHQRRFEIAMIDEILSSDAMDGNKGVKKK